MSVTIHTGHAIDVLRGMEAGSVQMVCTSPPYFAARKYGTDPVTWGGDPECSHSWREQWTGNNNTGGGVTWKQVSNPGSYQQGGPVQRKEPGKRGYSTHTCERCGAVQADLGREALHDCHAWARGEAPCPACYVCHIRSIFADVYRVLRPDGVLFLNLDDSMSGTGGGQKDTGKAAYNPETWGRAAAQPVLEGLEG